MSPSSVPVDAPDDAIMAKPAEIAATHAWSREAFGGARLAKPGEHSFLAPVTPPFSFTYAGQPSRDFLAGWNHTVEIKPAKDRDRITAVWTDPVTGLRVTAEASSFKRYPAVDWVLYFENTGNKDTPIIENINAADVDLATSDATRSTILHRLHGDSCGAESFMPYDTELKPTDKIDMAPSGGRSSNTSAFPFFNFEYAGQGIIAAIGWSGQWAASFERTAGSTRFTAGMELTHLVLHPGERVRTPRVVIMHYAGDLTDAHNRWRRLVLFQYCPKIDGRPIQLPTSLANFDRYIRRPGWATEEEQLNGVRVASQIGFDTFWLDAAWFQGDFPNGVGNWYCKPKEFPNGLKPLGDLCNKLGLNFIVWFEPERVAEGSQIAKEHPEFVFGGAKGGLFKLNDPTARKWLTDLLSSRISEWGITVYRNDFNMDPLGYWRANDAPDRQGMTEIRYVEGHYAMWDELRKRHPGLWIDNCASGGRRMDIEVLSRSIQLWRSDVCCQPGRATWDQAQNPALAQYVPLFSGATWSPDAYTTRSVSTAGGICQWGYLDDGFPMDQARQSVQEIKDNRKYWYGDIYSLTPFSTEAGQLAAWQVHRPDLNEGIILAFRRESCPNSALNVKLRGLDGNAEYNVDFIDDSRKVQTRALKGADLLKRLELSLPAGPSSLLVHYRRV